MGFNLGRAFTGALSGGAAGFMVGGPWGALAGALGGGLMGGFSSDSPYSQVGSPMDVRNINPYTAEAIDRFRSDLGFYQNNLKRYLSQADTYGGEADRYRRSLEGFKFGVEYDPMAAQRMFLSQAPELQQLAQRSLGTSAAEEQAKLLSAKAIQQAANQFAGGGLRSGAALKAMGEGASLPLAQYQAQREALTNNLLSQLYGQSFQGLQQGEQYKAGLGLQQQQLQYGALADALKTALAQQAFQGQLASLMQGGAQNALGMMGQYGAPNWWQPTYVPNANYMSTPQLIGSGLMLGSTLGTNMKGLDIASLLGLNGTPQYVPDNYPHIYNIGLDRTER